jgi:small nuclear ribonucleoprotein (snRNP)-like protein
MCGYGLGAVFDFRQSGQVTARQGQMLETDWRKRLECLIGKDVILDTKSSYMYLGRLTELDPNFIVLGETDVHDSNESHTTKEVYIMDAKKYGIKKNRTQVLVRLSEVVSISPLDAVIEY